MSVHLRQSAAEFQAPSPQVMQFTSLQQLLDFTERRAYEFPASAVAISLFSQRLAAEQVQSLCRCLATLQTVISLDLGRYVPCKWPAGGLSGGRWSHAR